MREYDYLCFANIVNRKGFLEEQVKFCGRVRGYLDSDHSDDCFLKFSGAVNIIPTASVSDTQPRPYVIQLGNDVNLFFCQPPVASASHRNNKTKKGKFYERKIQVSQSGLWLPIDIAPRAGLDFLLETPYLY